MYFLVKKFGHSIYFTNFIEPISLFINLNLFIMVPNFESIEKENIHLLSFPHAEVLESKEAMQQRFSELNRALALGNLEHSKTKIFFEDNHSKKVVETTVWALTDQRVILKQGHSIPINRIYKSA